MKVQVSNTNTPNWRDITVKSQVPTDLKCLEILAKNLWWSWNNEAINLFKSIDKDLWKSVHENPRFIPTTHWLRKARRNNQRQTNHAQHSRCV